MKFQLMLAYNKQIDAGLLRYPLLASPKYDGIRATIDRNGRVLSRRLKPIPNKEVQKTFGWIELAGLDGELIAGDPAAPDCYNLTASKIMTIDGNAEGVYFYVFDYWAVPALPYHVRMLNIDELIKGHAQIKIVEQLLINRANGVLEFEQTLSDIGYEGIMLRSRDGIYKFGRSTLKEQYLLKMKRFSDSEATVVSVYPRMKNNNEAMTDERGYAKRSSHKANKEMVEEVGGFVVTDLKSKVEFECSPGIFTQEERRQLWKIRDTLHGKILKYRFQQAGVKNKPRFPRAIGWRSRLDT
jgi:DNA ligase-1